MNATQRAKLEQVMAFTTCGPKQAQDVLIRNKWNVEAAANEIFEDGLEYEAPPQTSSRSAAAPQQNLDDPKLNRLFDSYAKLDNNNDDSIDEDSRMEINALIQFFSDIGVDDPENDPIVLVLALKTQAKEMLQYTRQEFVRGMLNLQCKSVEQLRNALPTLRHEFERNTHVFWEVYAYSFQYGLVPGQKVLTKDTAMALWRMLITEERFALMPQFLDFFQRTVKHGVNKDLWQQLSALVQMYNKNPAQFFQEFAKISSWPLVFDEFIDSLQGK